MPPPLIGGGIKRCFCLMSACLSVVCLTSVAYIGPKWRTEKPRKTKIGTEVAHVTRDSDTTFKVKRSKIKVTKPVSSPRRLRTGSCSGQRGKVLSVGNCCYVAVCRRGGRLGGARRYGAHRGRRGAGAYRVATRTACLAVACHTYIYAVSLIQSISACRDCGSNVRIVFLYAAESLRICPRVEDVIVYLCRPGVVVVIGQSLAGLRPDHSLFISLLNNVF